MKNIFSGKEKAPKVNSAMARATEEGPFAPFDWWLFTIMLIILSIGLVMVLSASGIVAEQVNGDKYFFFKRQVIDGRIGVFAHTFLFRIVFLSSYRLTGLWNLNPEIFTNRSVGTLSKSTSQHANLL